MNKIFEKERNNALPPDGVMYMYMTMSKTRDVLPIRVLSLQLFFSAATMLWRLITAIENRLEIRAQLYPVDPDLVNHV